MPFDGASPISNLDIIRTLRGRVAASTDYDQNNSTKCAASLCKGLDVSAFPDEMRPRLFGWTDRHGAVRNQAEWLRECDALIAKLELAA